jgi:hypothetical protein
MHRARSSDQGIDGVQWAEDLAGPCDVIARVQASGTDELSRLVVARIQDVGGALSCTVLDR